MPAQLDRNGLIFLDSRRLLSSEARELCRDMSDCFCEGETLANLALKWDNMDVLTFVLEAAETQVESGQGGRVADSAAETQVESGQGGRVAGGQGGRIADSRPASAVSRREQKEAASNEGWDMCDLSAACSTHGAVSAARDSDGRSIFRESSYRHAEYLAHRDLLDTDMPYIAADSGAARRDGASRLGMQVSCLLPPSCLALCPMPLCRCPLVRILVLLMRNLSLPPLRHPLNVKTAGAVVAGMLRGLQKFLKPSSGLLGGGWGRKSPAYGG